MFERAFDLSAILFANSVKPQRCISLCSASLTLYLSLLAEPPFPPEEYVDKRQTTHVLPVGPSVEWRKEKRLQKKERGNKLISFGVLEECVCVCMP